MESEDKNILRQDGKKAIVGYRKGRPELSGSISAKWKPINRIGLSAVIREEMFGKEWTPIIPALFIDGVLSEKGERLDVRYRCVLFGRSGGSLFLERLRKLV